MQLRKQVLMKTMIGILGDNLDNLGRQAGRCPRGIKNAWTELTGTAEVMEMVWAAVEEMQEAVQSFH